MPPCCAQRTNFETPNQPHRPHPKAAHSAQETKQASCQHHHTRKQAKGKKGHSGNKFSTPPPTKQNTKQAVSQPSKHTPAQCAYRIGRVNAAIVCNVFAERQLPVDVLPVHLIRVVPGQTRDEQSPHGWLQSALTHSLTHSLTLTLTHSHTHSLSHSLTHTHTHTLTHTHTHSHTHTHTLSLSLLHSN